MANLQVPSFNSKQFTWSATTKTFVAEASDFGRTPFMGRLYDDACDVGLELESQWTGKKLRFCFAKEIRDGENELQGWEFTPTPEALRIYPRFRDHKVVIFND